MGNALTPEQIAALLKRDKSVGVAASSHHEPTPTEHNGYTLTWCEFCKGNYIEEFHITRREVKHSNSG